MYYGCSNCKHYAIIYSNTGAEIGTIEITIVDAVDSLVEEDKYRIAESLKKQLHKRLLHARQEKELITFGAMFYENKFEFSIMEFTENAKYDYTVYESIPLSLHIQTWSIY